MSAPVGFDPSRAVAVDTPSLPTGFDPSRAIALPSDPDTTGDDVVAAETAGAENVLSAATGAIAQPLAGLYGLVRAPFVGADRAANDIAAAQSALTYRPRTEAGQDLQNTIGDAAAAAGNKVQSVLPDTPAAQTFIPAAAQAALVLAPGARQVLALRGARGAAEAAEAANAADGAAAAPLDNSRGASAANPPRFEAASAPKGPATPDAESAALPPDQQAARAATLRAVGLTEARESAVTGDKGAAATDYQTSRVDSEGGKVMSDAFQTERGALGDYSDKLVSDAGGTGGLDETSLHLRGQTILQPLEDLQTHLNNDIRGQYAAADARGQGVNIDLTNINKALADRASFIGTTDGQQLLRGVNAYLRQSGIADDAGELQGANVQQAERFKQYLNTQWTPQNARLVRSLKDAVDDDVTQAAGADVYAQARATRALRATLLDDPKGIASLLDSSGPEGINRKVALERVPDTVARLPVDQFGHVVDVLNTVSSRAPALAPQAQAALNEIRSQFMLRMQEQAQKLKGAWNNRAVTQYLNANSAKLAKVFTPQELGSMRTLNDAGNILDVDRSYPGSAAQTHNLLRRGAIFAAEHGPAAVGGMVGHGLGAMAGEMAGKKLAGALDGAGSRKAARKRIRAL